MPTVAATVTLPPAVVAPTESPSPAASASPGLSPSPVARAGPLTIAGPSAAIATIVIPSPLPSLPSASLPSPSPGGFLAPLPQPTPPLGPRPSPSPVGRRIYFDDFRSANSGFPTGRATSGFGEHGYDTAAGEYRIVMTRAPGADAETSYFDAVLDVHDTFEDFRLDVEARQIGVATNGAWGVLFRAQDFDNFYKVSIDPNSGQFEFFKLIGDRREEFVAWRPTAAILRGQQSNHLTIVARGAELTIRINEAPMVTVTDNAFRRGRIGFIANVWSEPVEYRFRNLTLSEAPAR